MSDDNKDGSLTNNVIDLSETSRVICTHVLSDGLADLDRVVSSETSLSSGRFFVALLLESRMEEILNDGNPAKERKFAIGPRDNPSRLEQPEHRMKNKATHRNRLGNLHLCVPVRPELENQNRQA